MDTKPWMLLACLGSCLLATPALAADRVRESPLAGGWFPADPVQLQTQVDGFLDAAGVVAPTGSIRALIAPHAGYAYSGPTAGAVFSLVRGQGFKRVLILSPSHYGRFRGLAVPELDAYRTPLGDVPVDQAAVAALRTSPLVGAHPDAFPREHSMEIELPLLQRALDPGWTLVPVLVGDLGPDDYQRAADLLRPLADENTLVVASSDFTHYGSRFGYQPFPAGEGLQGRIRDLDDGAIAKILAKDADGFLAYQKDTGITICGFRPIGILLRMLGTGAQVQRVAYATSGALTGDKENSVSYLGLVVTDRQPIAVTVTPETEPDGALTDQDLRLLHRLATLGLETAVLGQSPEREAALAETLASLPERLREPAGAFVTLKRHGDLRGCIGFIDPRQPLYRAVLDNGDSAARRDPRFRPVAPAELKDLELEVSVLTPPQPIPSWEAFRVGEQGIVLSKGDRRAVFLPEVATEQGWTREETLTHLARKAGLPADGWRDGASFTVFTSTHYAAPYAATAATGP